MPNSISHSSSLRTKKWDKKRSKQEWNPFSFWGTGTHSKFPQSSLSFFSLSEMFFVCVSLSHSLTETETHNLPPLLNIVKVSDGVILKGQCVPPLPKFVCRCCCYKFDVFLFPLLPPPVSCHCACRTPGGGGEWHPHWGGKQRSPSCSSACMPEEMTGRGKRCRLTGHNSFCIPENTGTDFHEYTCMIRIWMHK